jgi:hypothetical protein
MQLWAEPICYFSFKRPSLAEQCSQQSSAAPSFIHYDPIHHHILSVLLMAHDKLQACV